MTQIKILHDYSFNIPLLEKKIQEHINNEWLLYGNMTAAQHSPGYVWVGQPMIKYTEITSTPTHQTK